MGKINMGRVLMGGLIAGLIINISEFVLNTMVLDADWKAAMARMNLPPMEGMGMMVMFIIAAFVLGIATIWLYAGLRPRFTPGPKTAMITAFSVWFFAYLYPSVFPMAFGMVSAKIFWTSVIWGLVEINIAATVGGWVYQEQ
jgi:hypothetical protein